MVTEWLVVSFIIMIVIPTMLVCKAVAEFYLLKRFRLFATKESVQEAILLSIVFVGVIWLLFSLAESFERTKLSWVAFIIQSIGVVAVPYKVSLLPQMGLGLLVLWLLCSGITAVFWRWRGVEPRWGVGKTAVFIHGSSILVLGFIHLLALWFFSTHYY